jgi:hypothetical protein
VLRPACAALLAVLLVASAASAATELVISTAAGSAGGGRNRRLTPSNATFTTGPSAVSNPSVEAHGIRVRIDVPGPSIETYDLEFVPPTVRYAPGAYTGVLRFGLFNHTPGMEVDGYQLSCNPVAAHFTILDVTYAADDTVIEFSVDFEQQCTGGKTIAGSLRIAAGDPDCTAAADGAPCDDRDACTGTSACQAGECVGADAVECTGPTDPCQDPAVCAPTTASCLPVTNAAFGTPCDDGDACTRFDSCHEGACAGRSREICSDGDLCSQTRCAPAIGCYYPPAFGLCGLPGRPSSFLFVESPPGEPIGRGQNLMLPVSDRNESSYVSDDGVSVSFLGRPNSAEDWGVDFGPPKGAPLLRGTYENTRRYVNQDEDRPLLSIYRYQSGVGCPKLTGRFTIHEIAFSTYGGDTELETLIADAEATCEPGAPPIRFAVRYRAGEPGCVGAPDGTACDDANACTTGDACRQNVCVGGTATPCGDATPCHDAPVCDPTTGACLAASVRPDDEYCSAPDGCVPSGTCRAGTCTPEHGLCNDFDVCTQDRCDGAGACLHEPIDGTCWALRGTTTFRATAYGQTCECTARTTVQPLALYANGTFAIPGGLARCNVGTLLIPPESGRWTKKGRRYRLTSTNLPEIAEIVTRCTGTGTPSVLGYRTAVRVSRDQRRLAGTHREHTKGGNGRVAIAAVTTFRGKRTAHGVVQPSYTKGIRRCGTELGNCLREKIVDQFDD